MQFVGTFNSSNQNPLHAIGSYTTELAKDAAGVGQVANHIHRDQSD